MNKVTRPAIVITIFTFGIQLLTFITQIVVAYLFGANSGMDAFLAASVLPQYINIVLLGSLGFVFIPVFVDRVSNGRENEAWLIASVMMNICFAVLLVFMLVGIFFPREILALTAPGLPRVTRELAVQLSVIIWPSVIASGLSMFLTSVYHSNARFVWPSIAPLVSSAVNLLLTLFLSKGLGIVGLAVSLTLSSFVQLFLLLPIMFKKGVYQFSFNISHTGVQQVFYLLGPLVIASVAGKSTSIVERYLASSMPEGSISHLNYAFRIATTLSLFISAGLSTVVFQRMASHVADSDILGLRRIMSASIRFLWIIVAPTISIGIALSLPFITALFQRGEFSSSDSISVSMLFQIYLLSLAAASFGNITARGFYVLKDTRTVAIMVGLESVAYIIYTIALARFWGALGIAVGYVLLFNGSLLWQSIFIGRKTGGLVGKNFIGSFARIAFAALMAGGVSWFAHLLVSGEWRQLFLGGILGVSAYGAALFIVQSPEWKDMLSIVFNIIGIGRMRNES